MHMFVGVGGGELSGSCLLAGAAGHASNTQVTEEGEGGSSISMTFIYHCFGNTIEGGKLN